MTHQHTEAKIISPKKRGTLTKPTTCFAEPLLKSTVVEEEAAWRGYKLFK